MIGLKPGLEALRNYVAAGFNKILSCTGDHGAMIMMVISPIVLGGIFLVFALIAIRTLLAELPTGRLRRRWIELCVLNVGLIAGFASLVALMIGMEITLLSFVVALLAVSGGGFVMAVSRLSCSIATDLRRMSALEQAVITDPLTGLFNRRYLDARLISEVERARRHEFPLGVLMIDLDHFKKVNDRWGHVMGDLVLHQVGQILA